MSATATTTAPANTAGAAPAPRASTARDTPAGLTEPQLLALKRLETARAAIADLEPLDPDYLAAERYAEQLRRWNGEDE